jgi:hypothetical protein
MSDFPGATVVSFPFIAVAVPVPVPVAGADTGAGGAKEGGI